MISITRNGRLTSIPREARIAYAGMCIESAKMTRDEDERSGLLFLHRELLSMKTECRDGWYMDNSLDMIADMLRRGRIDTDMPGIRHELINGKELCYRVTGGPGLQKAVRLGSGNAAVIWDGVNATVDYGYLD